MQVIPASSIIPKRRRTNSKKVAVYLYIRFSLRDAVTWFTGNFSKSRHITLVIILTNVNQFLKLFYWQIPKEVLHKFTRSTTAPQMCLYTTLWYLSLSVASCMSELTVYLTRYVAVYCRSYDQKLRVMYLYIRWNDVTESMVTIRSPFCVYNLA